MKVATLLLTLTVAACGGGGGGGGTSGPPAPTPVVTNDSASTNESTAVTISVLSNDSAINASTLALASQPANGTASLSGSTVTYTPNDGFSGSDAFTYSVTGSNSQSLTGTVNITINDTPVAAADSFTVIEDTPTVLSVLSNDTDTDGTLTGEITIVASPGGNVTIDGNELTYTPPADTIGNDSFTYNVKDDDGAQSNTVTVTLDIVAITATTLSSRSLSLPETGYEQLNNSELGGTYLTSPQQSLKIPPNTVSFTLALQGDGVNQEDFRITDVTTPGGVTPTPLERELVLCDTQSTLCTASLPRRPDHNIAAGDWGFRVGTPDADLTGLDFAGLNLTLTTRTGPEPDTSATFPANIKVRPYLTATSISTGDLDGILAAFVTIANTNGITIDLEPTTVITDGRFIEVTNDFDFIHTAQLVEMGAADAVNIFFIEAFAGTPGQIGLAPGIPGQLGSRNRHNGVLINATIALGDANYERTTAEFAFHEMGHLLGLYHTTERGYSENDILDDTPNCTLADDANGNNQADIAECPDALNMMFWTYTTQAPKEPLTDDQKNVLYRSLIAVP